MFKSASKSRGHRFRFCLLALLSVCWIVGARANDSSRRIPPVAAPGESFTSFTLADGVRGVIQEPDGIETSSTHVILYLLPNGSTTEEALGQTSSTGLSWRYGIQHIAAQTRRVRELLAPRRVVTVVVESDNLSWPAWRKALPDSDVRVRQIVDELRLKTGGPDATVDLVAHSGGGSFIWGYLNSAEQVPDYLQHIVLLDANYSYADEDRHGDKILQWLRSSEKHRLIVLAYDDRRIMLNGKPVVSETGGTWRATDRMARRLERDLEFRSTRINDFQTSVALEGRVILARHPNPDNKILHTVIVERNGFVYGATHGRVSQQVEDLPFYLETGTEAYRESVFPR